MCDSVEEANYWEDYYIESAKSAGIYLWNRYSGGGNHKYNRLYTDEELKEHQKQWHKQYHNQLCQYNGERLTLCALYTRFSRIGIEHPTIEAKKYLIQQ